MSDSGSMQWRWPLALVFGLVGCAGSVPPVEFQGHPGARVVEPVGVVEVSALPRGSVRLGRLFARCVPVNSAESFDDRTLHDVDCSEARLRRLLREAASEHGGDALVELSCRHGSSLFCRATLALRSSRPAARSALAPVADVRGELGAQVFVSYHARTEGSQRPARAEDNVREVAVASVAQVMLGNLEVSCQACSELSVRDALRIAAGRIGASGVVGVRCLSQGDGQRCVAEAAVWEREGEL